MIRINGITFRNLEEQVAYLSEKIPLFEYDGTEFVIKQGNGTEIARIELNTIIDINITTNSDITRIVVSYATGETKTFIINMTSYLKKMENETQYNIAYVKTPIGEQSTIELTTEPYVSTIPFRDENGNIQANTPINNKDVANKEYVDDYLLLENIKDRNNNYRFIEGNGTPSVLEGVNITYVKWSLSGTHLMFVLVGNIANGTPFGNFVVDFNLPAWIRNKIAPVFSDKLEYKTIQAYANDYTNQNITFSLNKSSNYIRISKEGTTNITADRMFKIQFDLLIDNE